MKNNHLTDIDIQTFVLQKGNCDTTISEHITHCIDCKMKTEQYKILFEEIEHQENPTFDFNLSDLVMNQLPRPQPKRIFENIFIYGSVFFAILVIGIIFYFLRSNLFNLFTVITPILTSLIVITVMSLSVFLCIDMYTKFQKRMNTLNF
jgi:hypothetical protein